MIWLIRFGLGTAYFGFAWCGVVFYLDMLCGKYGLALSMLLCLAINAVNVALYHKMLGEEAQK